MKKSKKTVLIVIALTLLACFVCLVWFTSRSNEQVVERVLDTSRGPAFELHVIVPRMARPFAGILPDWIVGKLDGTPSVLHFDHTSSGARILSAGPNRVELKADDWSFFIESDGEGRIAQTTRLVFPIQLGGRQVRLSCLPTNPTIGYLNTASRAGAEEINGRFLVELLNCKNADSGKVTNWPPAALTVRGSFAGLRPSPAPEPSGDGTNGN